MASIATVRRGLYLRRMLVARFVRFLTILAVLFAPISMASAHGAMAAPIPQQAQMHHAQMADMPAGHCGDMDQGDRSDHKAPMSPGIDCTIACSMIMASAEVFADGPLPAAQMRTLRLATSRKGLNPESDPPPPRLS